jgi:GxxExxY protein
VHPLYEKADKVGSEIIGAAIEVHRDKGPRLIESIYERCMLRELELRSIPATTQKLVRVEYKGLVFDEPLRFDLLVEDCLLAELKAVEILHPSSKAQLFSYMKLLDIPIGLLINFHEPLLKNGIARMISRSKSNRGRKQRYIALDFEPNLIPGYSLRSLRYLV